MNTEPIDISALMRALADPTRRAVFERVAGTEEITVAELTRGKSARVISGRRRIIGAGRMVILPIAGWMVIIVVSISFRMIIIVVGGVVLSTLLLLLPIVLSALLLLLTVVLPVLLILTTPALPA